MSKTCAKSSLKKLPRSWVVVRFGALGDVLLTSGLLHYLHTTRGWDFTFVTKKNNAPALFGHPAINDIIALQDEDLGFFSWIVRSSRLASQFKNHGLLDLHGTLRTWILSRFWHSVIRRYPKFSRQRRLFLRTKDAHLERRLEAFNIPQRYSLAVEEKAPAKSVLRPVFFLSSQEQEAGQNLLTPLAQTEPCIALHPYATHKGKQWPARHWKALIHLLLDENWQVVIVGKSLQNQPLPVFSHNHFPPGVLDLTDKTSVRESAAVLSCSTCLVSGDSGPMHLATAVGTPVVALFGPTVRAWGFFPSGEHDSVLETQAVCRPCSLHGQKGKSCTGQCLKDISPKQVFAAVKQKI